MFGAAEFLHEPLSFGLLFLHRAAACHALGKAFLFFLLFLLVLRLFGELPGVLLVQCTFPRRVVFSLLYTVCAQMSKITQRVSLFFALPHGDGCNSVKKSV